jgi:hypothetical protein
VSSSILTPLADALLEAARGLGSEGVKGYRWPPRELAKLPAAVVELPGVERTPVDAPEDHLGQRDWKPSFPVIFYFDLSAAESSQDEAVEIVEAFIAAIDEDPSLGGLCQEAKAVEAAFAEYVEDEARPVIRWPVRVEILKFV